MEPFVERIVAGGVAMVTGLWVAATVEPGLGRWIAGPLLVLGGGASLLSGIVRPLEY